MSCIEIKHITRVPIIDLFILFLEDVICCRFRVPDFTLPHRHLVWPQHQHPTLVPLHPPTTLSHNLVSLLQYHDLGSRSRSSAVAREEFLCNVLHSANQCAERRFFVVLDCYRATSEYTEIIVRRAEPV